MDSVSCLFMKETFGGFIYFIYLLFFLCFVCFGLFEFNLFQALTVHHCEIQTNPMGSIMLSGKYFTLHAVFLNQWTFQHLYIHTSPLVCDTVKCFYTGNPCGCTCSTCRGPGS